MTTTLDQSLMDEIVRRILSVAQPDRIILFGSGATGEMGPDSDIDLLVLERAPGDSWKESAKIRASLRGMDPPFDIIVMETEWFDESAPVVGGLAYQASTYGRTIYRTGPDGQPRRPAQEVKRIIVEQWLAKSQDSLAGATAFLSSDTPHCQSIAFHAELAAETCLKAFLTECQIDCRKTHDIGVLLDFAAQADPSLVEELADTRALTPYALYFDDPIAAPEVSVEEARTAVALAQKTCDAVRRELGLAR